MGASQSFQHKQSYSERKLNGVQDLQIQTMFEDCSQEFSILNIGERVESLGNLQEKVQEILLQLGPFEAIKVLDNITPEMNVGFQRYPDNSIYYGELTKYGVRHGCGKQHWINEGNYLEGVWDQDVLHGKTRMIYPTGDSFECTMIDNKANGYGIYKSKRKETRGYWINNRLNGPGTEIRCNGVKYVGNFVNGTINGRGTFTLSNGAQYTGEVMHGFIHGRGTIAWKDLSQLNGTFYQNCIAGKGCYTDSDGIVYRGYFLSVLSLNQPEITIFFNEYEPVNQGNMEQFKGFNKIHQQ